MIQMNPAGIVSNMQYVIEAFMHFDSAEDDIKKVFATILAEYKSTMTNEQWEAYLTSATFGPALRDKVKKVYGLWAMPTFN